MWTGEICENVLEMRGIEPRAFYMQSERSTTELHLRLQLKVTKRVLKSLPAGGLKPPIFGLGDQRLIH